MIGSLASAAAGIGAEEARRLARRELADPIYHQDDPNLLERISQWIGEQIDRLLDAASEGAGTTSGIITLAGVVVVIIALIVLVRVRGGPLMRSRAAGRPGAAAVRTARDHRAEAERLAAAGQWAEAILERMRAIVRGLEERAILEIRPGGTADELTALAGAALPERATDLRAAARLFDDVHYGDRPATEAGYGWLSRLDTAVQATRPRPVEDAARSSGPRGGGGAGWTPVSVGGRR